MRVCASDCRRSHSINVWIYLYAIYIIYINQQSNILWTVKITYILIDEGGMGEYSTLLYLNFTSSVEYFISQKTLTFINILLCGWKITKQSFRINFPGFRQRRAEECDIIRTTQCASNWEEWKNAEKLNSNYANSLYRRYTKICV